jgi:hypothetical protein
MVIPDKIYGTVHFSLPLYERNFNLEPRLESEKNIITFDQLAFIARSKEVFQEIMSGSKEIDSLGSKIIDRLGSKDSGSFDFKDFKTQFKTEVTVSSRILKLQVIRHL